MKIEEGKFYKARNGQVFGPMERTPKSSIWVWHAKDGEEGLFFSWREEGQFHARREHELDLEEEAIRIQDTLAWKQKQEREHKEYGDAKNDDLASMTKHKLLDLAKDATRDRGLNYGAPEDNFKRIAEHWNTFLSNRYSTAELPILMPEDVAIMMMLMKIARLEHQGNHLDSWVDVAGYAACGAEIALRPSAVT